MTPDPVDKLARFTPAAPRIDRDELLFRAGRASAPTARWWKRATVALLVTQAATTAAWLLPPTEQPAPAPLAPSAPETPPDPVPLPPGSYGTFLQTVRGNGLPPPTPAPDNPSADGPPLSIASAYRGTALD